MWMINTVEDVDKAVEEFQERCVEDEHTDTGAAWDLLNSIRGWAQRLGGMDPGCLGCCREVGAK